MGVGLTAAAVIAAATFMHYYLKKKNITGADRKYSNQEEELHRLKEVLEQQKNELELLYQRANDMNEQLLRKNRELRAISEAQRRLVSTLDYDRILMDFCNIIQGLVRFDAGGIYLVDWEKGQIKSEYVCGHGADQSYREICLHIESNSLLGWVARSGKPVIVKDVTKDPRYYQTLENVKSEICVSIKINNRLIGIINLESFQPGAYDYNHLQILKSIANSVAIALQNANMYRNARKMHYETVLSLSKAVEAKDEYTRGHCERVTQTVLIIAEKLDYSKEEEECLKFAAILHDIGKIAVDKSILMKNEPLTEEEYQIIKAHPLIGAEILGQTGFLKRESQIILQHHERIDGKGYPKGLKGEEILEPAKILAVADAYDAMISYRPYRKAMTHSEAVEELERNKGTQFDPRIVDIFIKITS